MKKNILIICRGNIHRSVIAEELLRKIIAERGDEARYRIESRGIQGTMGVVAPEHTNLRGYPETYHYTSKALEAYSVSIPENKISTPVSQADADHANFILVLGSDAYRKLQVEWKDRPKFLSKMYLLSDVADPHRSKDADHLQGVVRQIFEDVRRFADERL